jgi:hypothetical protein
MALGKVSFDLNKVEGKNKKKQFEYNLFTAVQSANMQTGQFTKPPAVS